MTRRRRRRRRRIWGWHQNLTSLTWQVGKNTSGTTHFLCPIFHVFTFPTVLWVLWHLTLKTLLLAIVKALTEPFVQALPATLSHAALGRFELWIMCNCHAIPAVFQVSRHEDFGFEFQIQTHCCWQSPKSPMVAETRKAWAVLDLGNSQCWQWRIYRVSDGFFLSQTCHFSRCTCSSLRQWTRSWGPPYCMPEMRHAWNCQHKDTKEWSAGLNFTPEVYRSLNHARLRRLSHDLRHWCGSRASPNGEIGLWVFGNMLSVPKNNNSLFLKNKKLYIYIYTILFKSKHSLKDIAGIYYLYAAV